MATNLNVVYAGPPEQHVKVSAMPMAKLQSVLEQACTKFKPALDPAACQLVLHEGRNKRVIDLQVPFRLANIPTTATAKLEVVKVAPAGGAAGPAAAAVAAAGPAPVQAPVAAAPAPAPAVATAPAAADAPAAAAPAPAPVPQPAAAQPAPPPPAGPATPPTVAPSVPVPVAAAAAGPSTPTQDVTMTDAAPPAAVREQQDVPSWCNALGVDRRVVLFTKEAVDGALAAAAAASGGTGMDLGDDFFELTPEDFVAITRADKARKEEAAQFHTKAAREAAEKAKAASYGPIPVRVHLPDNTILQAAFSALEPLSKLQELLKKVLVSDMSKPAAFYLYTTPPKQVLKDLDLTFFKAQLVPAAHVHVHINEGKGPAPGSPLLKPEAQAHLHASLALDMALPGQAPFAAVVEAKKEEAAAAGASHTASGGAATGRTMEAPGAGASGAAQDAAAAVTAAGPRFTASGSKVPKWLKLG